MGIGDKIKAAAVDAAWTLKATADVVKADKDGNGKLNKEEYKTVSFYPQDDFVSTLSRNFERAAVDELKFVDGEVSISELAAFYKKVDANKDGKMDTHEYETALNKASFKTKITHPLSALANDLGHYGHQFAEWVSKPRQ